MTPLESLVAEVGRQRLFDALTQAYRRCGQVDVLTKDILVELRQSGDPAVVEIVGRHPEGAREAAQAVLFHWLTGGRRART